MELEDLKKLIPDLSGWSHADRIKLFAWHLHRHQKISHFKPADVKKCYEHLHMAPPTSIPPFLKSMVEQKEILKNSSGYRLENKVRERFEAKYGERETTVQVTTLLSDLPAKVPKVEEKDFLKEALICFRHRAFRAAIVMTWNLTFDHLCNYILNRHLNDFNMRWPIRYPNQHQKSPIKVVTKREDFAELKESEVIEICNSAAIITADLYRVLQQKLGTRNSAAHPSNIIFTQLQAEEYVSTLVHNVILSLKL